MGIPPSSKRMGGLVCTIVCMPNDVVICNASCVHHFFILRKRMARKKAVFRIRGSYGSEFGIRIQGLKKRTNVK